ncbi:MAG: PPOX class F420-dependent oxidoreductase [Actinomycetota bacterium]|nr:PPOX class F420-dependent oxidoreductase [Actinomycetota bacterium]
MIDEKIRKLAQQDNFGSITTLMRDGSPATHVMWVDADHEHILINTETGRAKFRNVQRDPRVSVVVWNKDNPYEYAEVRGRVVETVTGDEARRHIDDLSVKYTGKPYDPNAIQTERVILKIVPERQRA